MSSNTCGTCGATDGRAGDLIGPENGSGPMECECCRRTRETGKVTLCAHLPRTQEELAKIVNIIADPPSDEPLTCTNPGCEILNEINALQASNNELVIALASAVDSIEEIARKFKFSLDDTARMKLAKTALTNAHKLTGVNP